MRCNAGQSMGGPAAFPLNAFLFVWTVIEVRSWIEDRSDVDISFYTGMTALIETWDGLTRRPTLSTLSI